ncbi:MAG: ATP-dependent Clp protease ATP-binding subunit, partial [Planctomycetes bacterium]|nr:ATP-dependent Clp protease ATP-binding subunit [Planctomycetota bacterium]
FQSAVIIMTSNLGSEAIEPAGFAGKPATSFEAEVRRFFRPELYNRIDAAVTFHPLSRETIERIVEKELSEVASREGLAQAGLRLAWTAQVVELLGERGFDRRYGARPLQRAIEELVVTPLARFLLENPGAAQRELLLEKGEGSTVTVQPAKGLGRKG